MRLQRDILLAPLRRSSNTRKVPVRPECCQLPKKALYRRGALAILFAVRALSSSAWATNGDNLIGQGPISRPMGGVGVAQALDGITSVSANPATLAFLSGGLAAGEVSKEPSWSQTDFDATLFIPHVSGEINGVNADGHTSIFPIPGFAVTTPLNDEGTWQFGLAAFGSSGLGVDYRGTSLDNPHYYDFGGGNSAPLAAGTYTAFSNLKFVPSVAYRLSPHWSVGLGLQVDYATLDLGSGVSSGFGIGVQPGVVFRPTADLSFGLSYTSPQPVTFGRVGDLDGNGSLDTLKLESPQQVALGASYELFDRRLLVEVDGKWINWSAADGYKDFGWQDQWVIAVGSQVAVIPEKLFFRLGYNHGDNPVEAHNDWSAVGATTVQGKAIPNYYYESFRIIGFPAVVENHVTVGLGVQVSERVAVNLGYAHAFSKSISERGPNLVGTPTTIKSTLSEDSLEVGLTWRF